MRKSTLNLPLLVILAAVVIIMSILNPTRFLTILNFRSMAYQLPLLAFLSMVMMITVLSGGINLGIVATANFTGIVTALTLRFLTNGNPIEASGLVVVISMAMGIVAALGAGALSGFLAGFLRVPDILATLGTMTFLNGINIVLTKGYTLTGFPKSLITIGNGLVLGIPIPFLIFIVFSFVLYIILEKTAFGYSLYMVGSNYTAAKFSNIDTKSIILKEFLLSSLFAAITAFIMMGQLNSVKANYAESYLLVSILACFLGGVDPSGGAGKVSDMVISVIILQVISSGVNLLRMDPFFIQAMWGFIVITVIAFNYLSGKRKTQTKTIESQ